MNWVKAFFPMFNVLMGAFMALVGFKIVKPFIKSNETEFYSKYGIFLKVVGLGIFFYGVVTLMLVLGVIK